MRVMKPPVPPHQKAKGVTFSLKPDLYALLEARVEQLGYPWTKSSYVASLVMQDLKEAGFQAEGISPAERAKAIEFAKKAVENTRNRKSLREARKAATKTANKVNS